MKLTTAKFIHAINLTGTTYVYVDAKKHNLVIELDANYVSVSNGQAIVFTPLANCVSFEFSEPPNRPKAGKATPLS